MRRGALLGVLGALGLSGSVLAQGYGNQTPSWNRTVTGGQTCPVPKPSTVFVTVTPAFLPTVFSTVFSTVTSTVAPASTPDHPGSGSSRQDGTTHHHRSSTKPISWSPPKTITIPCSSSSTGIVPWSTDFLTLTLPPAPGQTASSVLTYTIVTAPASKSVESAPTPSGQPQGTLTITLGSNAPGGSHGGSSASQGLPSATPHAITITEPHPGSPTGQGSASITPLSVSPIPPGPFGISSSPAENTETESSSEEGYGGGNPLPTITITSPGASPSGDGQGGSQGGPAGQSTPNTITVPPPESPNGLGSQSTSPTVVTIYPPQSSGIPRSSSGQETAPHPESGLRSSGASPSSPVPGVATIWGNPEPGGNSESSSILTIITLTDAPGASSGGSNGGSPALPTLTLTILGTSSEEPSSGGDKGSFTSLPPTSFITNSLSQGPSGSSNGGGPALPTITLTIPGISSEGHSAGSSIGNPTSQINTITVSGGQSTGPSTGVGGQSTPISPATSDAGVSVTNSGGYGGSPSILPPIIGSTTGPADPGESDQGSASFASIYSSFENSHSIQSTVTVTGSVPRDHSDTRVITTSAPPQSSQSGQDSPGVITIPSSLPSGGYGALPPWPTVSPSGVLPGGSGGSTLSGNGAISGSDAISGSGAISGTGAIPGTNSTFGAFSTTGSAPPWANITRVTTISGASTRTKTVKSWTPKVSLHSESRSSSTSCSETSLVTESSVPPHVFSTSSRSRLSPIPSSGWNLTTSASQQVPGTGSPLLTTSYSKTSTGLTTVFSTSCLELSLLGPSASVVWPPPCSVPVSCSSGACTIVSATSTSLLVGSLTRTASSEATTSCTDEETNFTISSERLASGTDSSLSIPPMPSLPPPVSPAGSLAEAPAVTAPPQPSESEAGFDLPLPQLSALLSALESSHVINISVTNTEPPVSCISMTTLDILSNTFSWCAQVATAPTNVPSIGVPPTADLNGVTVLSVAANPTVKERPPPVSTAAGGAYVFSSVSVEQRLPATTNPIPKAKRPAPSTLSTVIVRSSGLSQDYPTKTKGPTAADCGKPADSGNFILNFDDLPPLGVGSGVDPHDVKPVPMYNPYHRFWFSPGFARLPPPPDPFKPSSGKLMLQFTPASISNKTEPEVPLDAAKIGVGPQRASGCFSFNFYGVSLGCDSKSAPCLFNFTGLRYDEQSKQEAAVLSQAVNVSACTTSKNCKLSPVTVSGFDGLTSVLITSKVNGEDKNWWADDLALGWFDNGCKKAACRSEVRNSNGKRDSSAKE